LMKKTRKQEKPNKRETGEDLRGVWRRRMKVCCDWTGGMT